MNRHMKKNQLSDVELNQIVGGEKVGTPGASFRKSISVIFQRIVAEIKKGLNAVNVKLA